MTRALQAFSSSYATARVRFVEAAARAGFQSSFYAIGQRGPDGGELGLDVATRGHAGARRALVISSGLHGIEGYFGSAVQLAWLERLATMPVPPDLRIVLIHALNPYGFAFRRRVNEENVDLNRNFMLAGQKYEGAHPAYRELDGLLNPESPPQRLEPFLAKALVAIARSGFPALKNAVAQGQYEYPRGLFFGGSALSATGRILTEHLARWIGLPERALHLDLHSGRGPFGSYALCIDLPSESPRVEALRAAFGVEAIEGFDPGGVLYEIRGALGPALEQLLPGVQYDCLLAEFGTYHALKVLAALRAENRAHHHGGSDARVRERTKRALLEAFCPRSAKWREQVIDKALRVIDQALAHLG